jgi:predicted flap endonuclease-1-like 5' DNA nuclease
MTKLGKIEGIGATYETKLLGAGVDCVEALLEAGAKPAGRKALEDKTGISHKLILEWVNHADLFRVKGVGEEYSDLLEEAGVDTVAELAQRNAENLHKALVEKNAEKNLVNRLPGVTQVQGWIDAAKDLPRIVEY